MERKFWDEASKIKTFAVILPENSWSEDEHQEERAIIDFTTGLRYGAFINKTMGIDNQYYIIFNCTLKDAKFLTKSYKKEKFLFGDAEKQQIFSYYTTNKGLSYKLENESTYILTQKDADCFLSRFNMNFILNLNDFELPDVINENELYESLNESRTFKSRALHRRDIYRNY